MRKLINQTISHTATAIALYSDSADDLETICYFLDFQETKDSPMKTQYPVVDLQVLGHAAQFASANALICNSDWLENNKPRPRVPLIYCKILLLA